MDSFKREVLYPLFVIFGGVGILTAFALGSMAIALLVHKVLVGL